MMHSLSSTQRFWVVTSCMSVGLLVAIAANIFITRTITRDWSVLSFSRREFEVSEEQRDVLAEAVRLLEELGPDRDRIRGSFADPSNPLPLIEAIENLGRRLGVRLKLALVGSDGLPGYTVTAEGTFPEVLQFLERLESLPFLVQFGDVRIVRSGELQKGGEVNPKEQPTIRSLVSLTATVLTMAP